MPEQPADRRDLGGDPACWAHEFAVPDDAVDESPSDDAAATETPFLHLPVEIRRRMERLRQELDDSGVIVPPIEESVLLREIDRARFPRRHERRFPSYGAIVANDDLDGVQRSLAELGAVRFAAPRIAAREVRRMADGIQSFSFVTPRHAELVLLPTPVVREIELVRLRRSLGPAASVVSRAEDGTVRVFDRHQIVIFDGTRWWTKPDAHEYTLSVRRAIAAAPLDTSQSILDFCVHSAGPGPGGTMLVWCLDDTALGDLRTWSVSTGHDVPIPLSLTMPSAHSAIRHLLFQVDGAAVVDAAGRVIEVGVHVRPSAEAHDRVSVPTELGTRHAAAMRGSCDVPGAVFFVVSEDGPVTVYADGTTVASIDMATDDVADLSS